MITQTITKNDNNLVINGKDHILNTNFIEILDSESIHISLDSEGTIKLFNCKSTSVNGETSNSASGLALLLGLTPQN